MSSFRRKGGSSQTSAKASGSERVNGLKPSVHNSLGLVSTGNKELDELLGGGMNLGTVVLLNSDFHSNHAHTLVSYMMAESLSMSHSSLLLCSDKQSGEKILSMLPHNRTLHSLVSKRDEREDSISEAAEGAGNAEKKEHLKVAWQYAKYIDANEQAKKPKSTLAITSQYCCSYDLGKSFQREIFERATPQVYYCPQTCDSDCLKSNNSGLGGALDAYLTAVRTFIQETEESAPGAVVKIFLCEFHSILALHGEGEREGFRTSTCTKRTVVDFLLRLRLLIRSKRVTVIMDAVPSALPDCLVPPTLLTHHQAKFNTLAKFAHTFITIDTFAGRQDQIPSEFARFCGFLEVGSVQHLGTLVAHKANGQRFGLMRDRRKLHIEPLHLPPEESRAQGSSGTDARLEAKAKLLFGERDAMGADEGPGPGPGTADGGTANIGNLTYEEPSGAVDKRKEEEKEKPPLREFKRLNMQAKAVVPGRGVNISSFSRKPPSQPQPGCGSGGAGKGGDQFDF